MAADPTLRMYAPTIDPLDRERGPLHQGRPHSELRKVEGKSDEHHRGAHDAEIRRCQKPGEENQHPQPHHGDGPAPPCDPRHPPDRAVRQAGRGIGHATPSNRPAAWSLVCSGVTPGPLLWSARRCARVCGVPKPRRTNARRAIPRLMCTMRASSREKARLT